MPTGAVGTIKVVDVDGAEVAGAADSAGAAGAAAVFCLAAWYNADLCLSLAFLDGPFLLAGGGCCTCLRASCSEISSRSRLRRN